MMATTVIKTRHECECHFMLAEEAARKLYPPHPTFCPKG